MFVCRRINNKYQFITISHTMECIIYNTIEFFGKMSKEGIIISVGDCMYYKTIHITV